MGLLDIFTGGKSKEAIDALKRAEGYFGNIQSPTIQDLTLPELQKYVEAGVVTPEQAQAYLQSSNAFNDQNIDQTGTGAQIQALNQLSQIANAGPEGTPMQQAQMENSINQLNTATAGQRGAIEQAMAAKGIPASLISAALQSQQLGQDQQQAHLDAVNAQAAAYQNALNALSQKGQLGGSLQGQQNAQANTVAQAQNAMQQFNAANQQQASQFNAGNRQEANMANMANRQQVANNNTGLANARTQYNANLPQQVFDNQMNKAAGQAGAATNIGSMQQKQGQQTAGIYSGLINLGTSFIPKPTPSLNQTNQPQQNQGFAHGGIVNHDHNVCMAHGGICMAEGGTVPGEAPFPGDTESNDIVHADLSPGEAVLPRSTVSQNPEIVSQLLGQEPEIVDTQDAITLLKAMRAIRMGA